MQHVCREGADSERDQRAKIVLRLVCDWLHDLTRQRLSDKIVQLYDAVSYAGAWGNDYDYTPQQKDAITLAEQANKAQEEYIRRYRRERSSSSYDERTPRSEGDQDDPERGDNDAPSTGM